MSSSTIPVKVVTRDTINRLLKDVRDIMKSPLTSQGIYYCHDDEDMMKGYALIIGPEDTPYFGGNYYFSFQYPTDYPHSPPAVKYWTNGDDIRFNPNLYKCGKVCISVLNTWRGDQWTSCQSISTILLTLCTLLCNNPLLNEPGITEKHPDFDNYTRIIEYKNIDVAVLRMVTKHGGYYPDQFEMFYPYVKENFLKNADKILKYLETHAEKTPKEQLIRTGMYGMTVKINYPELLSTFSIHLLHL